MRTRSGRSYSGQPAPKRRRQDSVGNAMVPAVAPVRSNANYKPNDNCKRHRLPDNAPKSVRVKTYVRRRQTV